MNNIRCEQCGENILDDCDIYIFDGRIFDDKGCVVDYLYENNKIDHVRLNTIED